MKRISPGAIKPTSGGTVEGSKPGKSGKNASLSGDDPILSREQKEQVDTATAAQIAASSLGEVDGWVAPLAADALLLRARLALLDGKLRVGHVAPQTSVLAPFTLKQKTKMHVLICNCC